MIMYMNIGRICNSAVVYVVLTKSLSNELKKHFAMLQTATFVKTTWGGGH